MTAMTPDQEREIVARFVAGDGVEFITLWSNPPDNSTGRADDDPLRMGRNVEAVLRATLRRLLKVEAKARELAQVDAPKTDDQWWEGKKWAAREILAAGKE